MRIESSTWAIVTLPAFILLAIMTALGVGLWLSALNVQYRDFMYALPFLIQIWMYASPVVYSASLVRTKSCSSRARSVDGC